MRIYQDATTETQVISDSYPFVMLYQDTVAQVQSKMIIKGDVDVDVGCGNQFGGKAEGDQQEGGAPAAGNKQSIPKVNDLIDAFGYESTSFTKDQWKEYFGPFAKKIKQTIYKNKSEAQNKKFDQGKKQFAKFILGKINDLTFYTPKDGNYQNTIIYSYYVNDEDEAPVFLYFLPGLTSFKV